MSMSLWSQSAIQDYIVEIMTYMKNNELMIYKDSSVLSSERAIHMFLNDNQRIYLILYHSFYLQFF